MDLHQQAERFLRWRRSQREAQYEQRGVNNVEHHNVLGILAVDLMFKVRASGRYKTTAAAQYDSDMLLNRPD